MSTDLERALRRALDATDGVVRASGRDLALGAMRGHRRRRAVRAGAAGAAVLVLAIVATALVAAGRAGDADQRTGTTPTVQPTGSPTGSTELSLDPATARPIAQVWPRAIRTLPARLPNGQDYNVLGEVGEGSFVVQAKAGFERYRSIYRFEPYNGILLQLIDAQRLNPTAPSIAPVGQAWVLDGRYVAVQTLEDAGEPSLLEVVSVADASPVARVDLPPGFEVDLMAWAGDHLVWTGGGGSGIYSAADPRSVMAGSNGFHLTGQGAWAVADESATISWWNVATGERHEAPAGSYPLPCYGRTCATGSVGDSRLHIIGVGGPGGSARLVEGGDNSLWSWGDHFMVVEYDSIGPDGSRLLWDLRTNTYAGLPGPIDPADAAGAGPDILVLSVNNERKVVVNLTAI
jgi:hypothetical protein